MRALQAGKSVPLPSSYGTESYEALEVSSGLRALFPGDSYLQKYINQTLKGNPDLQISAAALEEAGYNFKVAKGGRLPAIGLNSSANRTQGIIGSNTFLASNLRSALDVSWEVDVWGRIRAGLEAANYDVAAAKADYDAAQQSLVAQSMQAYFSVLATRKLEQAAQRDYESLKGTFHSTERRFERGTGSLAEVSLAKTDLYNAESALAATKDTHDQAARALAVLTGQAPQLLKSASDFPSISRGIKAGVPSELLRKRPDIQAAYLRISAADERIKVAHKDLFPSFSLTGSYGRQSSLLSSFLTGRSWSYGASLAAPLFDSGALKAELGASSARAEAALGAYRSTVLSALEEVENALGSEQYLRKQQDATQSALTSSRKATDRIKKQYESGLTDLPTLLETQRRVVDTEVALINITLQRYQNRIALALALGKGV